MRDYEKEQQIRAQVEAWFEAHNKEYLKFEKVENKRSQRADLHAFIVMDSLSPPDDHRDIIAAAEHDVIYLSPQAETLNLTSELVLELVRCGVRYDQDHGFTMFA